MPYVNAPNIVEIAALWTIDDQPAETTWHYHVASPSDTVITNMINTMFDQVSTHWLGILSDQVELVKGYGRDLSTEFSFSVTVNPSAPIEGTETSPLQPNNVSFAVKRYTGLAGRQNRGRVYWPGICREIMTSTNTLNPTYAGEMVTLLENLMTAQSTENSATEVIFHRALGTGTDVIAYSYSDLFLDSQRRRLPGHNIHH